MVLVAAAADSHSPLPSRFLSCTPHMTWFLDSQLFVCMCMRVCINVWLSIKHTTLSVRIFCVLARSISAAADAQNSLRCLNGNSALQVPTPGSAKLGLIYSSCGQSIHSVVVGLQSDNNLSSTQIVVSIIKVLLYLIV